MNHHLASSGFRAAKRYLLQFERVLVGSAIVALGATVLALMLIDPRDAGPTMRLYMPRDCQSCEAYADYLRHERFHVEIASEAELSGIRARYRLPAAFRGKHSALVDGLLIEGHVPAEEIRRVLARGNRADITGLVVPGLPPGAPGLPTLFPTHYTVYSMRSFGLLQPTAAYHAEGHWFH
jgi:hypothetical protein